MSMDEAALMYVVEAPDTIETSFFLSIGDIVYFYSNGGSIPTSDYFGDVDVVELTVDPGFEYTITASADSISRPWATDADLILLDRHGNIVGESLDFGLQASLSFVAKDTKYFVKLFTGSPGFYSASLANDSSAEKYENSIIIDSGFSYPGALDYSSDIDIFSFEAEKDEIFEFALISAIEDINLQIEHRQVDLSGQIKRRGESYVFVAPESGVYELLVSSRSKLAVGTYTLSTDVTRPFLVESVPIDGAANVPVLAVFQFTFSETVQRGPGSIQLRTSEGALIETYDSRSSDRITISERTVTLAPTAPLAYGTEYVIAFLEGAVEDLAGNDLAATAAYNFNTPPPPDLTPPSIIDFSPADASNNVEVDTQVVISFDEEIRVGEGLIKVRSSDGLIDLAFDVAVDEHASVEGNFLRINLSGLLEDGTQYLIELPTGVVKDRSGNAFLGESTYDFITRLQRVKGTDGPDALNDLDGFNKIFALGGNDTITGGEGADRINGGDGIDSSVYSSGRNNYDLMRIAGLDWQVQDRVGTDGDDFLQNIERIWFADSKIAIDMAEGQSGAAVALFLGTIAYDLLSDPAVVGLVLGIADGGLDLRELFQLSLDVGLVQALAGGGSNEHIANLVFKNLTEGEANSSAIDLLTSFMDGRINGLSQVDFLSAVAVLDLNQSHVDLIGLQEVGLIYSI